MPNRQELIDERDAAMANIVKTSKAMVVKQEELERCAEEHAEAVRELDFVQQRLDDPQTTIEFPEQQLKLI